jgi:hypothetical protein
MSNEWKGESEKRNEEWGMLALSEVEGRNGKNLLPPPFNLQPLTFNLPPKGFEGLAVFVGFTRVYSG